MTDAVDHDACPRCHRSFTRPDRVLALIRHWEPGGLPVPTRALRQELKTTTPLIQQAIRSLAERGLIQRWTHKGISGWRLTELGGAALPVAATPDVPADDTDIVVDLATTLIASNSAGFAKAKIQEILAIDYDPELVARVLEVLSTKTPGVHLTDNGRLVMEQPHE